MYRYEWNPLKHNTTSLDAVLPWQREPTEDSSKKSKIIIFVLCRPIIRYFRHL